MDPVDKRLLPGLPVSDDDWARDMHDFFNLIALVSLLGLSNIYRGFCLDMGFSL